MKYFIALICVSCLWGGQLAAGINIDSTLQVWRDIALPQQDRLLALYHATYELSSTNPEMALRLRDTLNLETLKYGANPHWDSLKIGLLKNLAFEYIYLSPDTAIGLSKQMLFLSERQNNIRQQIRAYRRLGLAYEQKGELDSANQYFDLAMILRRQNEDKAVLAIGYEDYAGLMLTKGKYDSSLMYYDSAFQIHETLNLERKKSLIYNNKGNVYYYLGDIGKAIDNYYYSIKIDKKLTDYGGIASTNYNIGLLYQRIGELDKAKKYFEESYHFYKGQSQFPSLNSLKILGAIASVESDQGNYEKALKLFNEILEYSQKLNFPSLESSALVNRGLVYARTNDFDQAILDFKKSIDISEQIRSFQKSQIALANLGSSYLKIGLLDSALLVSQQVLDLNRKSPSNIESQIAYKTLYDVYKQKGYYGDALEMFEKYIILRDTLESKTSFRRLTEKVYDLKIEEGNKRTRIQFFFLSVLIFATILFSLIIQRIRKQKYQAEKREAIQKAVNDKEKEERERIAKDLHDGPNSTLTVSLFSLESLRKPLKESPKQLKYLDISISSIHSAINEIIGISHDLLFVSIETGGLIAGIRNLIGRIESLNKVRILTSIPESISVLTHIEEEHAFRILKELLNNTIKYAEASLITLAIEVKNDSLFLKYLDDGKGMSLDKSLAYGNEKSLGLVNIQERCKSIGAKCQMKSTPGNGFEFRLTKKIKK